MSSESPIPFADLALAPAVLKAIDDVGYELPSPIQEQSIPPLLAGRDLLGQAQTGTGKTAAFALPLLSRLDLKRSHTQALVLTPTRELAIQVAEAMQTYARHLRGFHILPVYGGQSFSIQLRALKRGAQVVVGTPGRILDHLGRGTLKLERLSLLVLDEADEMLRMGFIDDVEEILSHTPPERQLALFSATMPARIRKIAHTHLREPVEVSIAARTATVETTNQRYWQVSGIHKLDALTRILEHEEFDAMIVFVRTRVETTGLAQKLEARGYAAEPLNGDMDQKARERTVDRLRKGALDILVATDVAARGLDVKRISHVLNYDIPTDTEAYVHRIGRTGRAGRKGEAILFVSPRERRLLRAIEKTTRQSIERMQLPSREAIADRRIQLFKAQITEVLESESLEFFEDLVTSYQQEHDTGPGEVAAALAYLLQRERPLRAKEKTKDKHRGEAGKKATQPPERSKPAKPAAPEKRARKEKGVRPSRQEEVPMETYRIEVGQEHGVEPKNIVGAIANEADLDSQYIGPIKIHEDHSFVDLPEGMPRDLYKHLRKVWVCGRQLQLSLVDEEGRPKARKSAKKPAGGKKSKARKKR